MCFDTIKNIYFVLWVIFNKCFTVMAFKNSKLDLNFDSFFVLKKSLPDNNIEKSLFIFGDFK